MSCETMYGLPSRRRKETLVKETFATASVSSQNTALWADYLPLAAVRAYTSALYTNQITRTWYQPKFLVRKKVDS